VPPNDTFLLAKMLAETLAVYSELATPRSRAIGTPA
jgi:hypothetical protein